ncbi:MAG TPA: rod shape-determining protein MreC [Solirubrobacteraceae bacterium]|nr:rod shape-determining protein MreC [Solirubrobacteraceae bacterium]
MALLVVISLALLTDYFGESRSSPLHSFQRGIATVLSPLQSGASTVLSPFRDAANYIGSTFSAKSTLARVQREKNQLVTELAAANQRANQNAKAAEILNVDRNYNLSQYGPKIADVIGEDPSLWYRTITLDLGTSSGVNLYDPVVGPGGLVGDVSKLSSDESVVSLVTSPDFSVGATIQNTSGASGLIQPRVGDPSTLMLNDLPATANVSNDQLVVTSGFRDKNDPTIESFAPAGIPIGTVSSTNPQSSVLENQQVQVTPLADLQYLSLVQILTKPHSG